MNFLITKKISQRVRDERENDVLPAFMPVEVHRRRRKIGAEIERGGVEEERKHWSVRQDLKLYACASALGFGSHEIDLVGGSRFGLV